MATDTSSTGNHTQDPVEERLDDFIGQQHQHQEQSDDPTQQDKSRQRTLALVKPDAVQANHQQAIIDKIISAGFTIIQQKQVQFTLAQACLFYREHENKPFYDQLTEWMSSAPIHAMVLEKENSIQDWRSLMGPTNAIKAREIDPTSIRALFGTDGSQNATHGSDCLTSAEREIDIVFGSVQVSSSTTDGSVIQTDLSTANISFIPSTDHDGSLLDDDTSNKDQPMATTKETDSSGGGDINTKATTATDDTESFVPRTTTATALNTINDVEHPVVTSDSLSHPASPDHDDAKNNNDAPTCPSSGFVELASGDNQGATATTTIQVEHIESVTTKSDAQEPIPQVNTDNKATAHVNSNTDEALEEHESQGDVECNQDSSVVVDGSLSDQHQRQQQQQPSSLVMESAVAKELVVDQSTPVNTHNEQQQSDIKDQVASLDSAGLDIPHIVEKVDEQEEDEDRNTSAPVIEGESTAKASETTTTSTADDNTTQMTDHGADSTADNSTANDDNTIDEVAVEKEQQQQPNQDFQMADKDDDHSITPEQETESLSIKEASNATPTTTIDTTDIKNEEEGLSGNHQSIDTTLAAALEDTRQTDIIPVKSAIHDSDNTTDDKQILTAPQGIPDTVNEHHDPTGENFATIPLTVDEEESNEMVAVNDIPNTGELAQETTTTTVDEPTSAATEKHVDAVIVEQESIPADVVTGVPQSTQESISEIAVTNEPESAKETDITGEPESAKETDITGEPESSKETDITDEPESTKETNVADEPDSAKETDIAGEPESVTDEPESTKETNTADEAEATKKPISVDTVVDDVGSTKVPSADDELQSTEILNLTDVVADGLESTTVTDESESTKEHVTVAAVDRLPEPVEENIPAPAVVEEQIELIEAPQSQTTVETEKENETNDVEPSAIDKPTTTEVETETDDMTQKNTASALAATAVEDEPKSVPNGEHQSVSDENDQAKGIEIATTDQGNCVSSHDEESLVNSTKSAKSDEEPVKERKITSTNHPTSPTRSPLRKLPTGTDKAPVKSTSPPTGTRKSPTSTTGSTKPPAATRLRRPGTTLATGTGSSATTTTGAGVKKTTPKTSTSPGRTPLPRVATLAKKPITKTTDESKTTTETKPATATKKRSSVISRLTAPTAASANKRTSETASSTPSSTAKTPSSNGTATTHRTRVTSGHHAPGTATATTRRSASKVSAPSAADKPTTARRTSPSSTADKTSTPTVRHISPPSSTTVHSKTARSTTTAPASSSRLSSTTTKSPPTDHTAAKRSPARRISPPTSTHLASTTKPTTKTNKPTTTEKKSDVIRKKAKPSGTTTVASKKTVKDVNNKPDSKGEENDNDAHAEKIHHNDGVVEHDENVKTDEDTGNSTATDSAEEKEHHEQDLENVQDHQDSISEQPSVVEAVIQQEEETVTTTTTTMTISDTEVDATTNHVDNELTTATLNPTATDSSTKRPKTPEMAQLRNKFENLQAPTTVTPTRSSNKQPSSAPHNIRDLISRFN